MRHRKKTLVRERELESGLSLPLPPAICNLTHLASEALSSLLLRRGWMKSLLPLSRSSIVAIVCSVFPNQNIPCHSPRELWDLTSCALKSSWQMQDYRGTRPCPHVCTNKCKVWDYRPRVTITGFTMQL